MTTFATYADFAQQQALPSAAFPFNSNYREDLDPKDLRKANAFLSTKLKTKVSLRLSNGEYLSKFKIQPELKTLIGARHGEISMMVPDFASQGLELTGWAGMVMVTIRLKDTNPIQNLNSSGYQNVIAGTLGWVFNKGDKFWFAKRPEPTEADLKKIM